MAQKMQPNAEAETVTDMDGRRKWNEIKYSCPLCKKRIKVDEVGCAECGIFFDWSRHAHLKITYEVVWKY